MEFEGKYSDFDGSIDDWKEVWQIARGKGSVWKPYITDGNWKAAYDAFFNNKSNLNILTANAFDKRYKDAKDPNAEGNVSGVTVKISQVERQGKNDVVIPPHIALRAEKDDGPTKTTLMFYALHEAIHWLSFPPTQGHLSTIRTVLRGGLTEALVSVVVDEILTKQGFSMTKPRQGETPASNIRGQDPKSYDQIMPIVNQMITILGVEPFGKALFCGLNGDLERAMQSKWKLGDTKSFVTLMTPLWSAADHGQGAQAIKTLNALTAR